MNLVAPLVNTHYAGGVIAPVNTNNTYSNVGGLNTVVGQQQYPMPLDFLSPEDNSWNIATGQRSYTKQYQTYYNSIYEFSGLISGVDLGQAQNFIGGSGIFDTFIGVPAQANGSLAVPNGIGGVSYTFTGSGQVILNLYPAPAANYTINFNYWALQQPETVNSSDMDALVDYGMYVAISNNAVVLSTIQDLTDIRQSIKSSGAAANSRNLAKQYLDQFDTKIRKKPIGICG